VLEAFCFLKQHDRINPNLILYYKILFFLTLYQSMNHEMVENQMKISSDMR
jgi:hypothetical protein